MNGQDYRQLFDRIRLFNFLASDIVNFAAQKYGSEFLDYMDMNCGALPDGDYEKVIDQSAPQQFLDLYSNMVMGRLELASKKILELGDGYKAVLFDYFNKEGVNIGIEKPTGLRDAFDIIKGCSIDLLANQDEISKDSEDELIWHKKGNVHSLFWTLIMVAFIGGIFKGACIEFYVTEKMDFVLKKI